MRTAARVAGFDPFVLLCQAHGLPRPETEVVFAPPRKYRADYLFRAGPNHLGVIVEREGGLFVSGRAGMAHAMPTAILRDMARSNCAQLHGFLYLRYTPQQLDSGEAIEDLKAVLG
jgi:hypothetical protein